LALCRHCGRAEPAPPRGASPGRMALRGRGGRWRGRWFSRRGAVPAPGGQGGTQANVFHPNRMVADEPVAGRRQRWSWRCAVVAGVRSPPLRGGEPRPDRLAGRCPEITRRAIFSEGRGLRARGAGPEAGRGITRSRRGKRTPGGHEEATLGLTLCRHRGRAELAPPGGGTQDKWPSGVRAGDGARSEFCKVVRPAPNRGRA